MSHTIIKELMQVTGVLIYTLDMSRIHIAVVTAQNGMVACVHNKMLFNIEKDMYLVVIAIKTHIFAAHEHECAVV